MESRGYPQRLSSVVRNLYSNYEIILIQETQGLTKFLYIKKYDGNVVFYHRFLMSILTTSSNHGDNTSGIKLNQSPSVDILLYADDAYSTPNIYQFTHLIHQTEVSCSVLYIV